MEMCTGLFSVILVVLSVILTIPSGSKHFANAQVTTRAVACYGQYAFEADLGRNFGGAQDQGSSYNTLHACLTRCSALTSCTAVDWDTAARSCWAFFTIVSRNNLRTAPGVNHYTRVDCPASSTPGVTTPIPDCVSNSRYDKYEDYYVLGGTTQNSFTTLLSCLEGCSGTARTTCTGVDYNTRDNTCYFHSIQNPHNQRRTDPDQITDHYFRTFCGGSSTGTIAPTTSPASTIPTTPNPNLSIRFRAVFTNAYSSLGNITNVIEVFRRDFCRDTGIRCSRLIQPSGPEDVKRIEDDPGDATPRAPDGSTLILGEVAPAANGSETITDVVIENFEQNHFRNFRPQLDNANNGVRLQPDTSTTYDGFSWTRVPATDPPEKEDDDGPLGLKVEYWVLIGLGCLAVIVLIIAVIVICCCCCRRDSESSERDQKRNERREKKEREREERRRSKEEKQLKDKNKDVEKGREEDAYQEPDVVPSRTEDPSGLSDDDKTY